MVGNKAQKAVAAALTGMMVLGSAAPAFAGQALDNGWFRLDGTYNETVTDLYDDAQEIATFVSAGTKYGQDRYDTMLDAVLYNADNWEGTTDVVLVSGDSYADALSASGLAGLFNSPIITTKGDSLSSQTIKAIKFLADNNGGELKVWIVGGEAAVSKSVEKAVAAIATGADGKTAISVTTKRVAGDDRVATSLEVMKTIVKEKTIAATNANEEYTPDPFGGYVFVANGSNYADALSVSSFAYVNDAPILLTDADGFLSEDQVAFLELAADKAENGIWVDTIGGPAEEAYLQLKSDVDFTAKKGTTMGDVVVRWIKGDDRYDTSKLVVEELVDNEQTNTLAVATGKNWPDALVGGAFIGARSGILVLSETGRYEAVEAAIEASKKEGLIGASDNFVLGGTSAVSEELANDLVRLYPKTV